MCDIVLYRLFGLKLVKGFQVGRLFSCTWSRPGKGPDQQPFRQEGLHVLLGLKCGSVRYIALHYITLHYIALHYIAVHYITLHYITLHYITLQYITLHYITLHCITLHYITLHYITLHCITLHYTTLHYITLHYITLHLADASIQAGDRPPGVKGLAQGPNSCADLIVATPGIEPPTLRVQVK